MVSLKSLAIALILPTCVCHADPLVYQVQKNGVISYLFGMLDLGVSLNDIQDSVLPLFEKSEAVALENVYSPEAISQFDHDPAAFYQTQIKALYPVDQSHSVDRATAERLQSLGIPESVATSFHDGECDHIPLTFLHDYFERRLLPVDFMRLAYLEKKPMMALNYRGIMADAFRAETAALGPAAPCSATQILAVYDQDDFREFESAAVTTFMDGQIERLASQTSYSAEYQTRAWLEDHLVPMLKHRRTFVAVGLIHVIGKKGLVNLLRTRGFDVVKVREATASF